jgi:hypothetical protein
MDLAGITDEAERVRLSIGADEVTMFNVINAARYIEAWIDEIRESFQKAGGSR